MMPSRFTTGAPAGRLHLVRQTNVDALLPIGTAAKYAQTSREAAASVTISGHSRFGGLRPLGAAGERIDFTSKIQNLFNATYQVPAGPQYQQAAFTQDGRTVRAQIGYRL